MAAEDRGPQLEAVVIVLLALCWVSVSLRCYTMGFLLRRFYAEDWLAIITLILYTAYSSFSLLGVHYGLGAHIADVPLDHHPQALFYKWAGQVAYVIIAALVKFIVGLLLLRLCAGKRWQCVTLWTLLVVSGLYAAFYVFVVVFQCQPVQFYWYRYDPAQPRGFGLGIGIATNFYPMECKDGPTIQDLGRMCAVTGFNCVYGNDCSNTIRETSPIRP
ncbi:hypothetical protein TruAng_006816 [Truncatella angustata]|nr:hypothetical protein TruAng_006816 [Truncatella angustata]